MTTGQKTLPQALLSPDHPSAKPVIHPNQPKAQKTAASPKGLKRLSPSLSFDTAQHLVFVEAEVVLREGPLELLLCPKRTKEHESILAADIIPRQFQTALMLIGAVPGRPAKFEPFEPPVGQKLKIWVEYAKAGQTIREDARQWIRDVKRNRVADFAFVFTGSRFVKVPGSERVIWLGDDGDLICVANFPGSVVDVSTASSKENADRLFEAWTERIPERGTKVRLIVEPVVEPPAAKPPASRHQN